ncbi:MOSC domain-containing protein [Granulicella paludicola]|uniref:MOSC domain-containing protein n=1 Tax=Granulicella paludicola TaxID=474951 RepID=UPI0021E06D8F|nr:MOSC domain-containing protein [Granulicella paludicola]
MTSPTIIALACSSRHGFSKQPQLSLRLIAGEGIEGDAHRGTTTQHLYLKRKNPTQPNLAQVHLFAAEMLDELAAKGFPLQPGDIGENLLTRHLDLLTLPRSTRLHIGPEAILEVTGLRTPCSQVDKHASGLQQLLWGDRDATGQRTRRAGIMSIVLTGGLIHPDDPIRVELPPEPHEPLGPV